MTGSLSLAAVQAAVDLLREAWTPPGPAGQIDVFGNLAPTGSLGPGCACAEIGAGGVGCGHTALCSCVDCVHAEHVQSAVCSLAGCVEPTTIKITPWSLQLGGARRGASEGDPLTDSQGMVVVGDERQVHAPLFACGTVHARQLIEDDRRGQQEHAGAAHDVAGRVGHRFYETTMWQYDPDQADLPGPIYQLRGHLEFAHFYAEHAAAALFAGDRERHDHLLADSRRSLAWALSSLTEHLEQHASPVHD